jgi:vancomycin resistance protein VanW
MRQLYYLLPATTRLWLRATQRRWADRRKGLSQRFATGRMATHWSTAVAAQQAINGGEGAANKVHNLQLAIDQLQGIAIAPGEVFSFWHLVGRPTEARGYRKSRSIVQGQVVAETGGGLCQLSGLVYWLGLKAGLQVTERHAHSLDIYREEERFAPLGSDATVAYGYKDLRLVNTLPHPVGFCFGLTNGQLYGQLTSPQPIAELSITFQYMREGQQATAITLAGSAVLCRNTYTCLYPASATEGSQLGC